MGKRTFIYMAWISIVVLAIYLRFHDIGIRPMHFDEATGARIAARHLETGTYIFNPEHFHGPTLSYCTKILSWFTGENNWHELNSASLRIIPALAGVGIVLIPILWIRWLGQVSSMASATLLATSPLLVYYSRMYIHEILLGFFGMLTLTLAARYWNRQKFYAWIIPGISFGLLIATKETFSISLVAWGLSVAACYWIFKSQLTLNRREWIEPFTWMLFIGVIVALLLYTSGLQNFKAAIDMIHTYFIYETESGHEKPFWYYLYLLIIPKGNSRLFWWEGLIALLAIVALVMASRKSSDIGTPKRFLAIFLALSILLQLIIYSLIGYKTPWLMVFPWAQTCLLAGMAFAMIPDSRAWKISLYAILIATLTIQSRQSLAVSGRFANDHRNPYAYVPTSNDVPRMEQWLVDLDKKVGTLEPLGVVGKYYWPLPWYLRSFESIGYWDEIEDSMTQMSVLFVMPTQFENANSVLSSTHIALPRGLRQDAPMMLYLRKDLWDKWMEEENQ